MSDLIRVICKESGVTESQFSSRSRKKSIVESRYIYYYLMRERYGLSISLEQIDNTRHHSTVIHGIDKVQDSLDVTGSNDMLLGLLLNVKTAIDPNQHIEKENTSKF